jgi:hypothetical protein
MEEDTPEQPPTKKKIIDHEVEEEASRLKQIEKYFLEKPVVSMTYIPKFSDSTY